MNGDLDFKTLMAAVLAITVLGGATPSKPSTPPQFDCPVLAYSCAPLTDPRSCNGVSYTDEYHFAIITTGNTITIAGLLTPHVSTDDATARITPTAYRQVALFDQTGITWQVVGPQDERFSFIFWRDTLGLNVTTSTPIGLVTWRGTCTKVTPTI